MFCSTSTCPSVLDLGRCPGSLFLKWDFRYPSEVSQNLGNSILHEMFLGTVVLPFSLPPPTSEGRPLSIDSCLSSSVYFLRDSPVCPARSYVLPLILFPPPPPSSSCSMGDVETGWVRTYLSGGVYGSTRLLLVPSYHRTEVVRATNGIQKRLWSRPVVRQVLESQGWSR